MVHYKACIMSFQLFVIVINSCVLNIQFLQLKFIDSMMHRHKPFHHEHHSPWDHSPLSQYWHAGLWPLWPKHHCVQNATVTKTPPNIYATKNFRHCDQNATVAKTPPKIFAMHLITIVGFFWLVFQSAFTECTLLTI